MNFNSFGFSTPRVLALGTVAATLTLGIVSGVFSTFYTTTQSGQTCNSAYGYTSGYGYGYGYDCTPVTGSTGGGSAWSAGTPSSTKPLTPAAVLALAKDVIILAKDIKSSEFKSAIETLIKAGVMNNTSTIAPDRSITRGEFLKLLALSNGYKAPVKTTKRFADLPKKNSLTEYVNYGVEMGWVNKKNTNFRPNDIITQGEVDKLIAAIKKQATADTIAKKTKATTRGKAAQDIVDAFYVGKQLEFKFSPL